MFGYVITNAEVLPKDRQARFRAFYCGLCRKLRRKYGLKGGVTLSFDMTFLTVLLNALYEFEEQSGSERCMMHPLKPHAYIDTQVLDYVADINVALAYHKCLDDWQDDRNPISVVEARLLKRAYSAVVERYPRQCEAIEKWIDEIHAIEKSGVTQIDPPVNATGRVLGALFDWKQGDTWSETLQDIGDGLGRFIYLMDAYDDLPADIRKYRYNPLSGFSDRKDYEEFCQSAMMIAVADATCAFEMLPIIRDADILRNILYSGIWTKYVLIRKKKESRTKE